MAFHLGLSLWALRVSNPRPSPCKGEKDAQVRALTCPNGVHWSTAEYLGVLPACYAGVMHGDRQPSRWKLQPTRREVP